MMLVDIPAHDLEVRAHHLFNQQWMLLSAGDYGAGHFNTMTVAWGSLGTMWNKPFVQVVVRPSRFTYDFMEQYDTFSLCAFPSVFHNALQLLGTRSGRDGNKIAESGLTPVPSEKITAPAFAEAELIIECRKNYYSDMNPDHFLTESILKNYPKEDFHRIYFGEILLIRGVESYRSLASYEKDGLT